MLSTLEVLRGVFYKSGVFSVRRVKGKETKRQRGACQKDRKRRREKSWGLLCIEVTEEDGHDTEKKKDDELKPKGKKDEVGTISDR